MITTKQLQTLKNPLVDRPTYFVKNHIDNVSLLHTKVANMIYVGGSVYTENKIQRG